MKKNIIIVHETLEGGGAEKVLINILNNIDYDRYNVDLLLIYKKGVYLNDVNENVNVRYILLKDKDTLIYRVRNKIFKGFIIKYFSKILWKKFIGKNYDVEIAFLEGPSSEILAASCNTNSKKIAWIHTDLKNLRRLSRSKEEVVYSKIDSIICVSKQCEDSFKSLYPQYSKMTKVIYNLIDTKKIKEMAKEKIEKFSSEKNIIAIGRLIESKRFDLIIKAHSEVIKNGCKHKLLILGQGPMEEELKKITKELKVEKTVEFLGFKKNPYPYIKNSDLYIMASDYEGLPLVICEALTLGKAIISTECTGPTELLNYGKSGILIKKGDYLELAKQIERCLIDEQIKKYYERRSIDQVVLFNEETIMKQIYAEIDSREDKNEK